VPSERRTDYIDLHQRMTRQETLMERVRDDVVEIKEAILGNGNPGLANRVNSLEGVWLNSKGLVTGVKWIIGGILTLIGLGITVYEVFGS